MVPDPHMGMLARITRRFDQDHLIAADPMFPVGKRPRRVLVDRDRARPRVEHDEVVAEPFILRIGIWFGSWVMRALYGEILSHHKHGWR